MNVNIEIKTECFYVLECPDFVSGQGARRAEPERITDTRGFEHHSNAALAQKGGIPKYKNGFTLIEVMIALSILSIALVVLLGLRNQGITLAARSRHIIEATLLARQKVTEVSAEGFPELGEKKGDFGVDFPQYTWRQDVVQTPFSVVREIMLEVLWKENNRELRLGVTTYLFDRGTKARSLAPISES